MNNKVFSIAFALGLAAVVWVGLGFVDTSALALAMTAVIGAVFVLGAAELRQFRRATAALATALAGLAQPLPALGDWLGRVPPALQNAVRQRIEGERVPLPGPALTPYLVGLLVMLGMLGTFLGMVVTFKGAVFALEGSTDLQAIRAALAAPIKGLGLSFGTSVAGVATSALLGLMSALSRRERLDAARQLDQGIATVLRPFSLTHQRQETYKALQAQAHALPDVVDRLQALMAQIERRSQQLDTQLLDRQAQFHRDVSAAYTGLAERVGQSLGDSLAAGAKAAGESLRPVVEAAMQGVAQDAARLHAQVGTTVQAQLADLTETFGATARTVSDGWTTSLQAQARHNERLAGGLEQALSGFSTHFAQRADALLASVHASASQAQAQQAADAQQRLQAWTQALETLATTLQDEWQRVGAQTLAQQQAVCQTLEQTAGTITARAAEHAGRTLDDASRLLARSEELVRARTETEAAWMQEHGTRLEAMAQLWRTELGTLRDAEAARGQAAVERLGALQTVVAGHLAQLGAALEAPLTRLLQTASEVPQAAAGVIAQLRQEMARLTDRDNQALDERTGLLARIGTLLESLQQTSDAQRTAIDTLLASSAAVLEQAASRFEQTLETHSGQAADVAAHVSGSAVELSSLGASFQLAVQMFSDANGQLLAGLQRIEGALGQSMARSDEQLAYYVAQAREVIDLSLASQQGIVEDLRRLHSAAPARALETAA